MMVRGFEGQGYSGFYGVDDVIINGRIKTGWSFVFSSAVCFSRSPSFLSYNVLFSFSFCQPCFDFSWRPVRHSRTARGQGPLLGAFAPSTVRADRCSTGLHGQLCWVGGRSPYVLLFLLILILSVSELLCRRLATKVLLVGRFAPSAPGRSHSRPRRSYRRPGSRVRDHPVLSSRVGTPLARRVHSGRMGTGRSQSLFLDRSPPRWRSRSLKPLR